MYAVLVYRIEFCQREGADIHLSLWVYCKVPVCALTKYNFSTSCYTASALPTPVTVKATATVTVTVSSVAATRTHEVNCHHGPLNSPSNPILQRPTSDIQRLFILPPEPTPTTLRPSPLTTSDLPSSVPRFWKLCPCHSKLVAASIWPLGS